MGFKPLEVHVVSLKNELELLLKLLGGTEEERWRAIEALTGITSRAITEVVATQLEAMSQSLKGVRVTMSALKENANELSHSVKTPVAKG